MRFPPSAVPVIMCRLKLALKRSTLALHAPKELSALCIKRVARIAQKVISAMEGLIGTTLLSTLRIMVKYVPRDTTVQEVHTQQLPALWVLIMLNTVPLKSPNAYYVRLTPSTALRAK